MRRKTLTFAEVMVELTRRCNLSCEHCARGDAQPLDISEEIIDSFLDATNGIYKLHITGGEPFLNLAGMKYLIEGIKRRRIFLGGFSCVTNGTVQNEAVVEIIRDVSAYIKSCVRDDLTAQDVVSIGVSCDSFHNTDYNKSFEWYRSMLSDCASVTRVVNGELPRAVGRAESLPYAVPRTLPTAAKIEYLAPGHEPICRMKKRYWSFFPNQITILCSICVSAKGDMSGDNMDADYSFSEEDAAEHILTFPVEGADDIMAAIEKYNADKPYCIEREPDRTLHHDAQIKAHPDLKAAEKALKVFAISSGHIDLYDSLCEKSGKLTEKELCEYFGTSPFAPDNGVKKANRDLTEEEERKMLFSLWHEQYGDHDAEALKVERGIRFVAIEESKRYLREPFTWLKRFMPFEEVRKPVATALDALDQLTLDDIDGLAVDELKLIYQAISAGDEKRLDEIKQLIIKERISSFVKRVFDRKEFPFVYYLLRSKYKTVLS